MKKMYIALILVFVAVFLGAFAQISLKNGMNKLGVIEFGEIIKPSGFSKVFTNGFVLLGVVLYAVSLLAWLSALSRLDVSFMYPLISVGYVITAIFAFIFLKENITLIRWAGILFIVFGSFLIARS